MATVPRLRIKSQWFKTDTPKTPQQIASAMGFIVFRVAQNALAQMRNAQFDIDIGPQYFAFLREVLVFLLQVADRMAYASMQAQVRAEFTTAMVVRVAEVLEENENRLLGLPGAGEPSHMDRFIEQFNLLSSHYADFGYGADGPDFGFVRYLGHRIEALMPKKDQHWVIDQIMAIEAPQAVEMLERSLRGLIGEEPRSPRRNTMSGD